MMFIYQLMDYFDEFDRRQFDPLKQRFGARMIFNACPTDTEILKSIKALGYISPRTRLSGIVMKKTVSYEFCDVYIDISTKGGIALFGIMVTVG